MASERHLEELAATLPATRDALSGLTPEDKNHLICQGTVDTRVLKYRAEFYRHLALTETGMSAGVVCCWAVQLADDLEGLCRIADAYRRTLGYQPDQYSGTD